MAKNESKNTKDFVDAEFEVPNFDTFVDEQIGFPPYWEAEEGASFYALPIARDERDPDFKRYLFKALIPTDCKTGDSDHQKEVRVKPGEFFTCSTYGALPLELYILAKIPIQVVAEELRKISNGPDGKPRNMWVFKVKMSPENKKLLDSKRSQLIQELNEKGEASKAQAMTAGA